MNSIIKTIDEKGRISDNMIYSLSPKQALIAYLEQAYSRNFNTWMYDKSKYLDSVFPLRSGKGYGYNVPNKNISVAAYVMN